MVMLIVSATHEPPPAPHAHTSALCFHVLCVSPDLDTIEQSLPAILNFAMHAPPEQLLEVSAVSAAGHQYLPCQGLPQSARARRQPRQKFVHPH